MFISTLIITQYIVYANKSFAQQTTGDQFYVIEDFSKGLQSHTTPYATPDGIANDVLNVRYNQEANALAKREPQLAYSTCYAAPVKSLFRYYKSDSTKYTVENVDQSIYYSSDAGACTWIGQGNTVGKRWNWLTYKDIAIGSSGYEPPVKWDGKTQITAADGSRTAGDLVTELGAPFAELNTGTNLDASSWYQYKVAFLNSSGQYYFSNARSNPIKTGATVRDIALTDIPLGQTGTTHRYIYRTLGNASRTAVLADTTYYMVADIANNTSTTYSDTMTDDTADGDAVPKWSTVSAGINMTPPYAKYLNIINEQILAANRPDGTAQGKSTLYVSELYNPDLWDTNSTDKVFLINPDDGDEITMLQIYMGQLYVGKNNFILKIYTGDTVDNWTISKPMSFVGINAPYSVATMPLGIIYLNRFGLYKFNGQNSELISDAVTRDIRNISQSAIPEVVGIYWNNEYDMAYADSSTGSATNNRVLIYDFARKSYTKDSKNVDSWAQFNAGTDFGTLYSGSSLTDGSVTAQSASPSLLVNKLSSEMALGTFVDTADVGTEDTFPEVQLAWTQTIDDAYFGTETIDSILYANSTIDRQGLTGTWTSPVYDLNVSKFDKIYWNADLASVGTVTWAVRSATTSSGVAGASWSAEYTNPSGSDISALTANRYVQIRATLTTTDINYTPTLNVADDYLVKMTYSKVGAVAESSVLAIWKTGFQEINSGMSQYPKILYECNVYYTGTAGTLNFQFENLKGDIIGNFNVDLSHVRDPSSGYFGNGTEKVFRYNFPIVPSVANYLAGDKFRITITENSTNTWKLQRIAIRYQNQPYVPYR